MSLIVLQSGKIEFFWDTAMDNPLLLVIVHFLLVSFVAGFIGTMGMTGVMYLITRSGLTNADMVRAIGSIFTRSLDSALLIGGILHIISGIIFAMLYIIGFNLFGFEGTPVLTAIGLCYGVAHGFVLSFILVAAVAEHPPLPQFQEAGFSVAVSHFVGHLVYGVLVGFVVGLTGFTVAGG